MNVLISPATVVSLAFRAPDFIEAESVSEAVILAAEQKFIRPVLGGALCDRLREGAYPLLLEEYVALPMALYVKALMLPQLAVQAGAAGVVEAHGTHLARAGEGKLRGAVRRLRAEALVLVKRAVEYIEAAGGYIEYDPHENILNRCSVEGGIVVTRRGGE
jgi:hypothetical protein